MHHHQIVMGFALEACERRLPMDGQFQPAESVHVVGKAVVLCELFEAKPARSQRVVQLFLKDLQREMPYIGLSLSSSFSQKICSRKCIEASPASHQAVLEGLVNNDASSQVQSLMKQFLKDSQRRSTILNMALLPPLSMNVTGN